MKHTLYVLWSYIYFYFKAAAFFKLNFMLGNITNSVHQVLGVVFIVTVFNYIPAAEHWGYYECLFLQGFANLVIVAFHMFFSGYTNFASKYLYSKKYDIVLMRPISSLLQVLAENISLDRIPNAVLAFTIMCYAYVHIDIHINIFIMILILLLYLVLNLVILACICILLTSISFSLNMRVNVFVPLMNVFEFTRYPFVLYGKIISIFFTFAIPLASVAYFPVGYVLRKIANPLVLVLPFIHALVLVPITQKVWRRQELKYTGVSI